jgi:hypothetical protein
VANTLTGLIGPLYEALDIVSREFVGFIPAVQRDNGNFARAAKGQVVSVPITPSVTAADIVPSNIPPNDGDQVFNTVNMTISKARYVPIKWNGEEQRGLNNNGAGTASIMVQQMAQSFRTLTNEVENDIALAAVKAASRATGTAGTAPFGVANDLSDFARTAQILDENGAPMTGRRMIVNSAAMANLRGKQSVLFRVNEAGTDDLLRRGTIGAVEGFAIGYSAGIKPVVGGTGTGFVTGAAYPVGATTIAVGTGTGTINAGDVVTFAGSTYQYDVINPLGSATGGGTSGPGVITIGAPGLKVAVASGAAVTVVGSYMPNIGFTQNALVLATRQPAVPLDIEGNEADLADDAKTLVDPYSGLAFEVRLYRGYRQIRYEVGLAWGVAAIKSEDIALLLG